VNEADGPVPFVLKLPTLTVHQLETTVGCMELVTDVGGLVLHGHVVVTTTVALLLICVAVALKVVPKHPFVGATVAFVSWIYPALAQFVVLNDTHHEQLPTTTNPGDGHLFVSLLVTGTDAVELKALVNVPGNGGFHCTLPTE